MARRWGQEFGWILLRYAGYLWEGWCCWWRFRTDWTGTHLYSKNFKNLFIVLQNLRYFKRYFDNLLANLIWKFSNIIQISITLFINLFDLLFNILLLISQSHIFNHQSLYFFPQNLILNFHFNNWKFHLL